MKNDIECVLKITKVFCLLVVLLTIFNFDSTTDKDLKVVRTTSAVILPSTPKIIKANETTHVDGKVISKASTGKVLKVYYGNISHYGPDCDGCGNGQTASGYKISKGNIYYNDKKYGLVRIVAGDRSIPFGTIIRMNIKGKETLAIVLDTGSNIGFRKKFLFDLLDESEKASYRSGVSWNTKVEVLRFGF